MFWKRYLTTPWLLMADDASASGGDGEGKDGEGGKTSADDLFGDDEPTGAEITKKLEGLAAKLAECGIKVEVGEDTTLEEFLDDLDTALTAYQHAKEHHGIDDGKPKEETETTSPPVEEPMGGTQMSLQMQNMQARVARSEARAAKAELLNIKNRLRDMVNKGQLSAARANEWYSTLNAKQLSLVTEDNRDVQRILDQMDILEKEHPHRLTKTVSGGAAQAPKEEPAPEFVDFSQASTAANGASALGGPASHQPMDAATVNKILDEVGWKKVK